MKNLTIGKRISLGFALVILISAGIGVFAIVRLAGIHTQTEELEKDHLPGLYLLGQIQFHAQAEASQGLQHLFNDSPAEQARFEAEILAHKAANAEFIKGLGSSIFEDKERAMYGGLTNSRTQYLTSCDKALELSRTQKTNESIAFYQNQVVPAFKAYLTNMFDLQTYNKQQGDRSAKDVLEAELRTSQVVVAGSIVSLLLCVWIAWSVVQAIRRPLVRLVDAMDKMREGDFRHGITVQSQDEMGVLADGLNRTADNLSQLIGLVQKSGIQVNTGATEMAATLKEQQATSNEVAATTVEVGSTAKEISANAKELGQTMGEVVSVAEHTAQLAVGGQTGLTRLEATMGQIMEATATISAKLAILNEKTANITTVVTTINKVADQTNLLSLNAAIEAEKAGEAGQGFSVVATEIRRLADQTAVATYDIEQMVKEMQSAVAAGVMGMDKFNEEVRRGSQEVKQVTGQLGEIIQHVRALAPRFETANEGMQSQSAAAGQISEALSQLGDTTQQSAQAFRQNTEAIEQLTVASRGLQEAVSRFKVKPIIASVPTD